MNDWVDVLYGSIYSALPRMANEGLVAVSGTSRVGALPQRTIYRITQAGRDQLRRLLTEAWVASTHTANPIDVALFFLWSLPLDEVDQLITTRLKALDTGLERLKSNEKEWEHAAKEPVPPAQVEEMMNDLFDHSRRAARAERAWLSSLQRRLRAGVFDFPVDSAD